MGEQRRGELQHLTAVELIREVDKGRLRRVRIPEPSKRDKRRRKERNGRAT